MLQTQPVIVIIIIDNPRIRTLALGYVGKKA